jgi:multicomponent Na+:H+ antiporter subunit G
MQLALDVLTGVALATGVAFFLAGTVGVLRFPDIYTRLHAMTKADNLGLGWVVLAVALQAPTALRVVKLVLIWVLLLVASTTACHLIARTAVREGVKPWQER